MLERTQYFGIMHIHLLYVIGVILGVTGLLRRGKGSKPGKNGAMPTAKVADEQTDIQKGEIRIYVYCTIKLLFPLNVIHKTLISYF